MDQYHLRNSCRICDSKKLFSYLDLGTSPLANSYITPIEKNLAEFKAPLEVCLCEECGLSQLSCVVDPDLMFRHYLYVSSTPKTFRDHCDSLAVTARRSLKPQKNYLALDIASNDGCLLRSFEKNGFQVLGVDPAKNLAAEANSNGIPTICDYWSTAAADRVLQEYGRPSIITGQNVFAHVNRVHEFVQAVSMCLSDDGLFILEFPYVLDFIEQNLFDTVYHEHLSYVGLGPARRLLRKYGLEVICVERFPALHGGTIRIISARQGHYPLSASVDKQLKEEEAFGLMSREPYVAFSQRVQKNKIELLSLLRKAKEAGRIVWGYGASAKGNTLLNYYGIDYSLVDRIIDDNPRKWGLLTPGTHIPIVGINELATNDRRVDDLLLLAWNFGVEIQERSLAVGYKGDFIYPVPSAKRIKGKLI